MAGKKSPAPWTLWPIKRGDTLTLTFLLKDDGVPETVRLTGATAKFALRLNPDDTTAVLEASTTDGRIVITPILGRVAITIPPAVSALLDFTEATGDVEVTFSDGVKETVLNVKAFLEKDNAR